MLRRPGPGGAAGRGTAGRHPWLWPDPRREGPPQGDTPPASGCDHHPEAYSPPGATLNTRHLTHPTLRSGRPGVRGGPGAQGVLSHRKSVG